MNESSRGTFVRLAGIAIDELKAAFRALIARSAFSALVVGVLVVGLACTMFMLVMITGFVIRPLPFPAPDQLLHAGFASEHGGDNMDDIAARDILTLRHALDGKADIAGLSQSTTNLSDLDRPERFDGAVVTANLWRVLGVAPALGRDFNAEDERPGAPAVVVLSWDIWQQRYNADPAIVGREVRVNSQPARVIGVMPRGFSYPYKEKVWVPAQLAATGPKSIEDSYVVVLRRHADVSDAAISTAFDTWFADAARAEPDRLRGLHARVEPLKYLTVSRTTRGILGIMLAAVALVLLVACANAANLLLTRTIGRRQELAVRAALGASRARLVMHLLAQSLLLSVFSTALALPLALAGVAWQQASFQQAESGPPHWLRFDLDATVITMAIAAALLTALATGILPALRAADSAPAGTLRDGTRSVAGGAFARISRVLVIAEIALSCLLLISVGTMVRGIAALDRLDLGIDTNHLLTARVALFTTAYPTGADQVRLFDRLLERLRADPEVVAAGAGTPLPARISTTREVVASGTAPDAEHSAPRVQYGAVDDGFFGAYGVALQEGRLFDSRDTPDGERVAVVDRRFAERLGGDGPVVGRRYHLDPADPNAPTVTIVGVVARLTLNQPSDAPDPTLLVPLRQDPGRIVSIAVRTRGDATAFAPRLNAIMHDTDADVPLYWVRDFATLIKSVTYGERVIAEWFGAFGLIALLLAGAGLYGVMAFSVGQRIREIGVRRALGAPDARVLRSLFSRSFIQMGIGLAIGLALGIPFAHMLTQSLPSIERGDTGVVLGALAVLMVAALFATAIPARRALRVDPMVALRYE
jgi:predicted permease